MTRYFIGLIHKDQDSDFGVSFPDFPGCVTAGVSLDEARSMAEEALAFHIEGLRLDGHSLPEPSSLTEIMNDPANRDGVAVMIPAEDRIRCGVDYRRTSSPRSTPFPSGTAWTVPVSFSVLPSMNSSMADFAQRL